MASLFSKIRNATIVAYSVIFIQVGTHKLGELLKVGHLVGSRKNTVGRRID